MLGSLEREPEEKKRGCSALGRSKEAGARALSEREQAKQELGMERKDISSGLQ